MYLRGVKQTDYDDHTQNYPDSRFFGHRMVQQGAGLPHS